MIELNDSASTHPPLVFVHGLSGSWPNWLEQLPVFAGRNGDAGRFGDASAASVPLIGQRRVSPGFGNHRVLALDLPGFGRSPMPPGGEVSIAGYADLLDALLEQLGIESAAVVGNSMGGFIAAELAIRHPRRVERLVLVSPAGISTHQDPRLMRYLPWVRRMERLAAAYGGWIASHADAVTRRPALRNAFFGMIVPHPRQLPAALVAEQLRGAGKPGLIAAAQAISDYDLRPHLERIACPTLVVWGDRDRVITRRDLALFAELIPGARKVMYEDTGHVAMLERPAEFNALLAEFLAE
ncbi:MAG TPA: alpha/beta hydrolase [Solirubrobacteraceae bacterium]|nr:alpha/beta hydrolase [Solirubrobacteraceae bacterium]